MKVSIVIPTYNVEKYINQCLDSVINQLEKDIEIIVIDDVSKDQTVDIIKVYMEKDQRIKLLFNEQNSGPSYSRNRGIKEATGEYIAFLDSDDWWNENRLTQLIGTADDLNADMICDDQLLINDDEEEPWGTVFKNGNMNITEVTPFTATSFINKDMGLKPIIRRDFLVKNHIFFQEGIKYGEDYLLFLDCLLSGAKAYLAPEGYYYYRTRAGSLVTNMTALLEQTLETTNQLLRTPFYINNEDVKNALLNRKTKIEESIKYYRFMQPIKEGNYKQGLIHMIKSPSSIRLLIKRSRSIIKNRIIRKIR